MSKSLATAGRSALVLIYCPVVGILTPRLFDSAPILQTVRLPTRKKPKEPSHSRMPQGWLIGEVK